MWRAMVDDRDMFDVWEYRAAFFEAEHLTPHFIVASEDGVDIGLLALWHRKAEDWLEFFGGELMEHNRFQTTRRDVASALLGALFGRYWLNYIETSETELVALTQEDASYALDLSSFGSVDAYLASFSGKHRKNLRRDLDAIQGLGPLVYLNRERDVDALIEITNERFGSGSFLANPLFVKGFRKLVDAARRRGELHLISIEIGEKVVATQLAIEHRNVYTVLIGAALSSPLNVGKRLIMEHLHNADRLACRTVDFLSTEPGWKKLWNLTPTPNYEHCNFSD